LLTAGPSLSHLFLLAHYDCYLTCCFPIECSPFSNLFFFDYTVEGGGSRLLSNICYRLPVNMAACPLKTSFQSVSLELSWHLHVVTEEYHSGYWPSRLRSETETVEIWSILCHWLNNS